MMFMAIKEEHIWINEFKDVWALHNSCCLTHGGVTNQATTLYKKMLTSVDLSNISIAH